MASTEAKRHAHLENGRAGNSSLSHWHLVLLLVLLISLSIISLWQESRTRSQKLRSEFLSRVRGVGKTGRETSLETLDHPHQLSTLNTPVWANAACFLHASATLVLIPPSAGWLSQMHPKATRLVNGTQHSLVWNPECCKNSEFNITLSDKFGF